ncbi:MAG: hypothetical protein QG673_238 [Pseudomonadota bacterium]|nr:hypothetical protein [Pseudomonadota bacterium]
MHDPNLDSFIVAYQTSMLPNVNYNEIETEDSLFPLIDLEYGILESCIEFLEVIKPVLQDEKLMPMPESLVAHLCAYLGAVMTVHTVHSAVKLEPLVIKLIQQQAKIAYQHFAQYGEQKIPWGSTIIR